jgi:hypothetical protein
MDIRDVIIAIMVFVLLVGVISILTDILVAYLRGVWRRFRLLAEGAAKPAPLAMELAPRRGTMAISPDYIRADDFVLPRRRIIIFNLDRASMVGTAFLDNNVQLRINLGNAKQAKTFMKALANELPPTCPHHGTSAAGADMDP